VGTALLVLAGLLVAAYVAASLLLYAQQRSMIYLGGFTRTDVAQTDLAIERDGVTLRGWMVNPGQSRAVIYFGGNAESIQDNRSALASAPPGTTSYLLAYRGYGASEGEATEPLLLADAEALYDHVQVRHPRAPISVIGRSLGSGVASHLAARRPVARVVLVTPFDSLVAVAKSHYPFMPVGLLMRERYESFRKLPLHQGPFLILRAEHDEIVPASSTYRLVEALPREATVVVLEGTGHNTLSSDPDYWNLISRFLEPEGEATTSPTPLPRDNPL